VIYGKTYGTTTITYRHGSRTTHQCEARSGSLRLAPITTLISTIMVSASIFGPEEWYKQVRIRSSLLSAMVWRLLVDRSTCCHLSIFGCY